MLKIRTNEQTVRVKATHTNGIEILCTIAHLYDMMMSCYNIEKQDIDKQLEEILSKVEDEDNE